jgi:azurin
MKSLSLVFLIAAAPVILGASQAKSKAAAVPVRASSTVRTVQLTGGDTMKYDVTSIHARPAERLHVVLKSVGTAPKVVMAHNFVVLKAGVNPIEFTNAAMNARATDFIPPEMNDKVLVAAKGLAGPGETVDVTFTAPTKPGTYTYLCSFPGHYMVGMKGELVVR